METFKIQRKFYKGFDTIYQRIVEKTMLIIKDSEKKVAQKRSTINVSFLKKLG